MSDPVIRLEGVGKQYNIGAREEGYKTLRESLMTLVTSPFRRTAKLLRGQAYGAADLDETIWALRDVSLEIGQGDAVGIIGPNGAGKTTLLKVLSRITDPTEGMGEIRGRVGSLLEVGTGFHPELTGRENIYLYAAILGMKKVEIDRKYDEIVAFAEVEKFIDTPVKHYSTGMQVRLAFSVAAHLEPEILLVDEVLAVGDARFQKKCLGRMENVAGEGRTVLFVSHNMVAMESLCKRAVWLERGRVREIGEVSRVVQNYLQSVSSARSEQRWDDQDKAPGNDIVRLRRTCVRPAEGPAEDAIKVQDDFVVEVDYWNLQPGRKITVTFHLINSHGIFVLETGSALADSGGEGRPLPRGLFRATCHVPGPLLNNGGYTIHLFFIEDGRTVAFMHRDALQFEVLDSMEGRGVWLGTVQGVVRPRFRWTTESLELEAEEEADTKHSLAPPPGSVT